MSLRTFFGGKDDPITEYKGQLVTAVKEGNIEALRILLQKDIEAPPAVFDAALAKAISNNQVRMARLLIEAPGSRTLDTGYLRSVVYDGKTELFRLLKDNGWDFASAVPSENGQTYAARLKFMDKDYEADQLRNELAAVKKELTQLKENCQQGGLNTGPLDDAPRRPKNPTL
ncbi:MAG: hypothetical protein PSY14_14200 [bacterium]|nr:hypothetical protein [bacterium]